MHVPAGYIAVQGLQYGRKGYVLVELRLSWMSNNPCCPGLWVCSGREIAAGSLDIHGSQAKAIAGIVMVYGSRKVVVGYAGIRSGCSVGHCELTLKPSFSERGFLYVPL